MNTTTMTQARALQADLLGSAHIWIPRREILMDWLKAFLIRGAKPNYVADQDDTEGLDAIGVFLRQSSIPVA